MGERTIFVDDTELFDACEELLSLARERGLTLGSAESCTGGLVCGCLTSVPGSSDVVRGSVVSYAIPVKREVLGVSGEVPRLRRCGLRHRHRRTGRGGARKARGDRLDGPLHAGGHDRPRPPLRGRPLRGAPPGRLPRGLDAS